MDDSTVQNKKFCECGCGELIPFWSKKHKQERRFKNGHQWKFIKEWCENRFTKDPRPDKRGPNNPLWKGGKVKHEGYFEIRNNNRYVKEHRLIWEKHHKACLLSWGIVHHINENKTDNRIENLQGMMRNKHISLHHKKAFNRICAICKIDKSTHSSIGRLGRNSWLRHPETKEWLCNRCYQRLWARKKYNLIGRI